MVKSFNFMGTTFRGLMMMDMFMDTLIHGFLNQTHNYKIKSTFLWDLKFVHVDCPIHEIHKNEFTVNVVSVFQTQVESGDRKWMVVAMAAGASVLVVAVVICVCRRPAQPRSKFD